MQGCTEISSVEPDELLCVQVHYLTALHMK
jgi:hypothetical protein